MDDPNDITIQTYREGFDTYSKRTPSVSGAEFSAWIDKIISLLPSSAKILELGSATGRDARYFREHGVTVTCTDIIPEALELLRKEGFETSHYDFRDQPDPQWLETFDAVFANAVLLHAPADLFPKILQNLGRIVKSDGIIAFSLKTGTGEEITEQKMEAPRFFKYYSEKEFRGILQSLPFSIEDVTCADNYKWLQVILRNAKA